MIGIQYTPRPYTLLGPRHKLVAGHKIYIPESVFLLVYERYIATDVADYPAEPVERQPFSLCNGSISVKNVSARPDRGSHTRPVNEKRGRRPFSLERTSDVREPGCCWVGSGTLGDVGKQPVHTPGPR